MSDGSQSCASCAETARERDEARAEVERLREQIRIAKMVEARLQAEVKRLRGLLARIEALVWHEPDDEDDLVEAVQAMRRERDETRAEVERLRAALTAAVPQRMANQSCVEGREVVDADWLLENWSTLRDDEELLCTVGGVRRWLGVVLCDALTRPADAAAPE